LDAVENFRKTHGAEVKEPSNVTTMARRWRIVGTCSIALMVHRVHYECDYGVIVVFFSRTETAGTVAGGRT